MVHTSSMPTACSRPDLTPSSSSTGRATSGPSGEKRAEPIRLGLGYAGWGRRAATLDREFEAARAHVERLEREREACAGGARTGQQQWSGHGVVRAIYPQLV